jgi:hypothetical protein
MYKKADETVEYVNSMLETSEYYLQHDLQKENDIVKGMQEREQLLADQKMALQTEQNKKQEEENLKKKAQAESFNEMNERLKDLAAIDLKEIEAMKGKKGKKAMAIDPADLSVGDSVDNSGVSSNREENPLD